MMLQNTEKSNKQTDRQTNRWTGPLHEAALAVASGGLIKQDKDWTKAHLIAR